MSGLTMGSLFDGIGGFPLAAIRSGITPVWASEIEAFPIEVTKQRFPSMIHVGDITKLNGAELPPVDIICGGSPCQDLSVAGARAGLSGARSGLFMEQVRLVKEMRNADEQVLLGLHSMCKGADAQFFNGHTNITSSRFLVFGVKGMLSAAKNVRNAMLFNVLSFMSDKLLTVGNTVAALDELYIWLSNPTAIEYIRNCLKRVRKKESAMLLASQNLEDFDQEQVREMTKPLFSIPPHQFLFNAGSIDKRSYMEMLQLDEAEYNLIKFPQRGVCLYKCGNERYLLEVHAPSYKEKLFGTAGGR